MAHIKKGSPEYARLWNRAVDWASRNWRQFVNPMDTTGANKRRHAEQRARTAFMQRELAKSEGQRGGTTSSSGGGNAEGGDGGGGGETFAGVNASELQDILARGRPDIDLTELISAAREPSSFVPEFRGRAEFFRGPERRTLAALEKLRTGIPTQDMVTATHQRFEPTKNILDQELTDTILQFDTIMALRGRDLQDPSIQKVRSKIFQDFATRQAQIFQEMLNETQQEAFTNTLSLFAQVSPTVTRAMLAGANLEEGTKDRVANIFGIERGARSAEQRALAGLVSDESQFARQLAENRRQFGKTLGFKQDLFDYEKNLLEQQIDLAKELAEKKKKSNFFERIFGGITGGVSGLITGGPIGGIVGGLGGLAGSPGLGLFGDVFKGKLKAGGLSTLPPDQLFDFGSFGSSLDLFPDINKFEQDTLFNQFLRGFSSLR